MSNKIYLSIISACYNVDKFLDDFFSCLDDIDCKEVEYIIINDGSKDNTKQLISDYVNKNSKSKFIKFIDQENKGYSKSKNIGLSHATGKYVVFIDPDDFVKYNSIKLIIDTLKKENPDALSIKDEIIKEKVKYSRINFDKVDYTIKAKKDLPYIYKHCMALKDIIIGTPFLFYKLDILKKMPNFPNVFQNIVGEDTDFEIRYLLNCNKIVVSSSSYYLYRKRKGSITNAKFNEKFVDFMDCMNRLLEDDMPNEVKQYALARKSLNSIYVLSKMISSHYDNKEKINYVYNAYSNNLKYIRKCKLLPWYMRYFTFLTKPYFYLRLRSKLK